MLKPPSCNACPERNTIARPQTGGDGAEAITLSGHKLVDEVIGYARTRNETRIALGKPTLGSGIRLVPLVNDMIRQPRDIDIHLVGKESSFLLR